MKKLLILLLIFVPLFVQAVDIDFFFSPTCPHCEEEMRFLNEIKNEYEDISVHEYNVFEEKGIEKLKHLYIQYQVPKEQQGLIPAAFTKEHYFIGFNESIGQSIRECVEYCQNNTHSPTTTSTIEPKDIITLPLIGEINIRESSPLVLSIVFGALDGFNACAMVALAFLLTVLIGIGIRKRIILIGGTFILVSGIVYFLFISAWLNLFLALEQVRLVTYIIGIIITVFALFMLKDYFQGTICKLCSIDPKKQGIFAKIQQKLLLKMQKITTSQMPLVLMLSGVAIVAAGVNFVELVCSFGFPLAFTKILASMSISGFSFYFYLIIYILFYMLDDFIIFLIAVTTLRMTKMSDKYLKAIKLISAIILLALGIIILINPGLLL